MSLNAVCCKAFRYAEIRKKLGKKFLSEMIISGRKVVPVRKK